MISIIIPIYNAERFLKECLDSVIQQTYSDLEIILVNDGSTDSSLEICKEYAAKDRRITVVSKENGGQMSAWIRGVKLSHGEYIGFVDSDDLVHKEMYRKLLETQKKYNADIVMCGRSIFDRFEENETKLNMASVYAGDDIKKIYNSVFPDMGGCISQARWDKLFKREIIVSNMNAYCGICVRTMEDRFIVSSSLLSAKVFATIDEPLYKCRLVNNSSSKKARPELYDIAELLYATQERMLKDKKMYEEYVDNLELTRLDYLKMIVIRNICRKNDLTFLDKIKLARKLLKDKNYREIVLNNKDRCVAKFGKFIYLSYKLNNAILMVMVAMAFCALFEKDNKNGF